jgi:hypothetical protein
LSREQSSSSSLPSLALWKAPNWRNSTRIVEIYRTMRISKWRNSTKMRDLFSVIAYRSWALSSWLYLLRFPERWPFVSRLASPGEVHLGETGSLTISERTRRT